MYKLATDKRPRVVRPKKTFAYNQTEADNIHSAYKPVKINFSYFNYTGGDITIIDRENMKFTIKPLASGASRIGDGIMVVKNYIFNDAVIIDEITLSSELTQDRELLRKAFANRRRISPNETAVDIVYTLSPEAFREFDECVYIRELDIVVTRNHNEKVVHPYSEEGMLLNASPESLNKAFSGLGFRWVTHKYLKETLYLNFYGMVVSVSSVQDLQMEEGFYVYVKGLEDTEGSTRLIRLSLEDAIEKYNLTKSLYDAQRAMSIEERLANDFEMKKGEQKLSILDREHQLKMVQASHAEQALFAKMEELDRKSAADRESFAMENAKRQREHEQYLAKLVTDQEKAFRDMEAFKEKLQLERDSQLRKEYYEDRSLSRKDSSEITKWLPGLILGAGLLIPKLMS